MEQVGEPDPDKDAQFEFINSQSKEAMSEGIPVISVDTKKKENIGNFKNEGTEYRPVGQPRTVLDHDFFIPELGKVAPYGVYVLNDNTGFVNLGISADTGLFAMTSIRRVSEDAFDSIDIEYIGPHKGWSYIIRGFKL